jgi:hypothetical protein
MLLNVVDGMEPYLQYKDAPKEELQSLAQEAQQKLDTAGSVEEREQQRSRLRMFTQLQSDKFRASVQFFSTLTPQQLLDLRNGQTLTLGYNEDNNGLDPDIAQRLQQDMLKNAPGEYNQQLAARPVDQISANIRFFLGRDRPDRVNLFTSWRVTKAGTREGVQLRGDVVDGQPDLLRNPNNSAAHTALQSSPDYKKKIALAPQSSSASENSANAKGILAEWKQNGLGDFPTDNRDWVDSADYLEEVHKKTGLNVIADYYTRVYPKNTLAVKGESLLSALNEGADALKSEWQADDTFLRFRRFNYYSERQMDIPNHWLNRWSADRKAHGSLSLDSLAEMAALPVEVMQHQDLGMALLIKYGLEEAPLVNPARDVLRLYAALDPAGRQEAQSAAGVEVSKIMEKIPDVARRVFNDEGDLPQDRMTQGRFYIRLKGPGTYSWTDLKDPNRKSFFPAKEDVQAKTLAQAESERESILKGRGLSGQPLEEAKGRISGPGASLWAQAQFGDYLVLRDLGPFGGLYWGGFLSKGVNPGFGG